MNTKKAGGFLIPNIIYALIVIPVIIYAFFFTDMSKRDYGSLKLWSDGWVTESGETVNTNKASAKVGETVIIKKSLPSVIDNNDSLCFMSHNANLTVLIDGVRVYEFINPENFTGYGYGDLRHTINLSESDAGREVCIRIESVFRKKGNGYIEDIYIGLGADHEHFMIRGRLLSTALSISIIFFGIFMIGVYFFIPNKDTLPYNIISLGISAVLMGTWCIINTGLIQLITGQVIGLRILNYLVIQFAAYPVICFASSFLVKKNKNYQKLAFTVWLFVIFLIALLRFGLGIDMHNFILMLYCSYGLSFAFMAYILLKDRRYCRINNIERNHKYFNAGAVCVIIGAFSDMIVYLLPRGILPNNGGFIRLGLCGFIFTMILQFLDWWSGERELMQRNDFINKILQYAVSSDDPEENINEMLAFLGKRLNVERAFIFEEMGDGTFANTYEWCAENVPTKLSEFDHIPLEGHIGKVFDDIEKSGQAIIRDVEDLKEEGKTDLYRILKDKGIRNTISGALEANGRYIGICGVENIGSEKNYNGISEIIRLLSYFFGQLILQRDNNKKLIGYGYSDLMTGVGNRRAYERFEKYDLDKNDTYGYIMCDINGLKRVNDSNGHEAGDDLIKGVCDSLVNVFGKEHVYRMGGDEFVAFSFAKSEDDLKRQIEEAKRQIETEERSASIGYVFNEKGSIPYSEVKIKADQHMYREKQLFYQGRNERRRRSKD